jgi:uncharacterized protein
MGPLAATIPFVKVIVVFCLMLIGIRLKLGLGLSILFGSLIMGLAFGLPVLTWGRVGLLALVQGKFLFLAAIVGLILILSDALEYSGQSGRLMDALSGYLVNPRLRLIFFPALIGLLPMPGGAVFSAPLVKAVSADMSLADEEKAVINYWFRHVWELAWPLYPGIILTVALADIPIGSLISRTWPATLAMFALGWLFFLRSAILPLTATAIGTAKTARHLRVVLREAIPLLIAIVGSIGLESGISLYFPGLPFEWGVVAALAAAVVALILQNKLTHRYLLQVLRKKALWSMLFVITAIFVFKDVMQATGVVTVMAGAAGSGVALFAAAVFLPFFVGAVAGINVAFVGATFPLLLGLLKSLGMESQVIPYLVLASFSGFTGVMISPLHICFLLTCSFFGADTARTWRKIIVPCLCFFLIGGAVFWFLLKL